MSAFNGEPPVPSPFERTEMVKGIDQQIQVGQAKVLDPDTGLPDTFVFMQVENQLSINRMFWSRERALGIGQAIIRAATGGIEIAAGIPENRR